MLHHIAHDVHTHGQTDANGEFTLDPAPAGRFFVNIDGRMITGTYPDGDYYPFIGKAWHTIAGRTDNLVNEALRIGCVEEAILLTESGSTVRASLRSRDDVDVSQLARQFGGGGHARAAGFRSETPIDKLKQQIIRTCQDVFHCFED